MPLKRTLLPCIEFRARQYAVHRALAIDEILRMITLQLRGESNSLLSLAISCKTWSSVALEALWAVITSQQLARISLMRKTCIASKRLDIYAERLCKVQVLVNIAEKETDDISYELPMFKPCTIWCLDSTQPINTSFLRPHVSTLIFAHDRGIWNTKWLSSFSRDLHNVSSSLKVLEISLIPRDSSMEVLNRLGDLHVLQRLKLQLTDDCAQTWMEQRPLSGGLTDSPCTEKVLHALEELDIEAPITIVETILALTASKLRKMRVTGAPFDSATMISSLFAQISEGPWATQLTHLRYGVSNRWSLVGDWEENLNEWGIAQLEHNAILLTNQNLRSLLRLSSLSHLALTFHTHPHVDDLFLEEVARKLPLLQNLSISGRYHDGTSYPPTTLRGVLGLTRLRSLSALQLPLDLRLDVNAGTLEVGQGFDSLTRLCVSGSPAPTSPCVVAPLLAATFPRIRKVYAPQSLYEEPCHELWDSAWNIWKSCRRDARSLEVELVEPDLANEQRFDEDFFLAAVKDAIGIDESENDSVDYLTCPVDMNEYYTRFPDPRRHSLTNDMHVTSEGLST